MWNSWYKEKRRESNLIHTLCTTFAEKSVTLSLDCNTILSVRKKDQALWQMYKNDKTHNIQGEGFFLELLLASTFFLMFLINPACGTLVFSFVAQQSRF